MHSYFFNLFMVKLDITNLLMLIVSTLTFSKFYLILANRFKTQDTFSRSAEA